MIAIAGYVNSGIHRTLLPGPVQFMVRATMYTAATSVSARTA